MRKLIFNLHLYLALIAGAFLLILGLTGTIMAFEQELDHLFHPKRSYVKAQARLLSLADIATAVGAKFPGEKIGAYLLSNSPGLSYRVALRRGTVSINQYTGEVLDVQPPGPDFLGNVHQLHLRLLLRDKGDTGQKIVSWAGIAMFLVAISGFYLWWPAKRLKVAWSGSWRRFWFDLHHAVGALSFVFLAILAFTGVMIGFERTTVPLFYRLTNSAPSQLPSMQVIPSPNVKPLTPDQALEIARAALPGTTPFAVSVPGPKDVYRIASRYPEDLTPGGRCRILVDQYSGKVLFAEGSRTAPAGARLVIMNRAIHTGDIFGIPSKIVMSLASLAVAVQFLSGIALWWRRVWGKPAA